MYDQGRFWIKKEIPVKSDFEVIRRNKVYEEVAQQIERLILRARSGVHQVEDEPTFEVTVENVGSTPLSILFSPHLADLQPEDPAQKIAYSRH